MNFRPSCFFRRLGEFPQLLRKKCDGVSLVIGVAHEFLTFVHAMLNQQRKNVPRDTANVRGTEVDKGDL